MSWRITGSEKNPVDPYFANVSLLLHGNGSNGSTTIIDSSPSPKTVTAVGNAQISTAQSKFGGSSIAFDGTGDCLAATIDPINIRSTPFTIESWSNISTRSNYGILGGITNDFYVFSNYNGIVYTGDGVINNISFTETALPLGAWFHAALTFDGTTYRAFINGTQQGSSTTLLKNYVLTSVTIGGHVASSRLTTGLIDDLRITKVARYTANFTPPTAPFPDF